MQLANKRLLGSRIDEVRAVLKPFRQGREAGEAVLFFGDGGGSFSLAGLLEVFVDIGLGRFFVVDQRLEARLG